MELTKADLEEICAQTSASAPIPVFRDEWEEEFIDTSFQSLEIKVFGLITSIYYLLHFLIMVFGHSDDGAGGSQLWIFFTWLPELASAIFGAVVFFLFTFPCTRKFCKRHYDWVCGCTTIISYLAAITPTVILEVRRSKFQRSGADHITWGIDYSAFPPVRTCNDTDPSRSFEFPSPDSSSIGCNNLIISGNIFSIYILHNLLPRIFRNQLSTAIAVSAATSLILVIALLSVGTLSRDIAVISAVAFQLLTGLGAAYFCDLREKVSREHFAVAKGTKFATEQDRNLLFTLVPRNVVQQLQSHEPEGGEMLGREITCCTVMFCALEPQEELQAAATRLEFGILDDVFSAFDLAVEKYGMFKYQHVRCAPPACRTSTARPCLPSAPALLLSCVPPGLECMAGRGPRAALCPTRQTRLSAPPGSLLCTAICAAAWLFRPALRSAQRSGPHPRPALCPMRLSAPCGSIPRLSLPCPALCPNGLSAQSYNRHARTTEMHAHPARTTGTVAQPARSTTSPLHHWQAVPPARATGKSQAHAIARTTFPAHELPAATGPANT
jgi:hypothetical protein